MIVIERHLVDGDIVKQIEHDLTQAQLDALKKEFVEDGVIITFTVLGEDKPAKAAPAAKAAAAIETVKETVKAKLGRSKKKI